MSLKLAVVCLIVAVQQISAQNAGLTSAVVRINSTKAIQFDWLGCNNLCQCKIVQATPPNFGNGYIYTPGVGAHKLHKEAKPWNEARKVCISEGAQLAVINSKKEEQALLAQLTKEYKSFKGQKMNELAWLGAHNLFLNNKDWVTVTGQPLQSVGYDSWYKEKTCWGPQPDNKGGNQHCQALIRVCGYGTDDVQCDWPLAFFCEKPEPRI